VVDRTVVRHVAVNAAALIAANLAPSLAVLVRGTRGHRLASVVAADRCHSAVLRCQTVHARPGRKLTNAGLARSRRIAGRCGCQHDWCIGRVGEVSIVNNRGIQCVQSIGAVGGIRDVGDIGGIWLDGDVGAGRGVGCAAVVRGDPLVQLDSGVIQHGVGGRICGLSADWNVVASTHRHRQDTNARKVGQSTKRRQMH
jgi:hypothetical protein